MKFKKEADKLYSKLEFGTINGKLLHYKKRIVYPVLNSDGSINWFNLLTGGSWFKLIGVILFVLLALGFIWEYHSNFQACIEVMNQYNNLTNIQVPNILP